mgnify:CR=1 FL=1
MVRFGSLILTIHEAFLEERRRFAEIMHQPRQLSEIRKLRRRKRTSQRGNSGQMLDQQLAMTR